MIQKTTYRLDWKEDGRFDLYTADGTLLFLRSAGVPMQPVTNRAAGWTAAKATAGSGSGGDVITIAMPSNALFENPRTILECHDDFIAFYFTGTVTQRASLDKWNLLARGSEIQALEVLNYRSHINSPSMYEVNQTVLARRRLGSRGCTVNTEDSDMMFAPHPMLFVMQNLEHNLVIAPMQLLQAESAHMAMQTGQTVLRHYHLRIGNNLFWLEPGETL
ncbi:MAG: hypothetical protein JW951_01000, partial [Lentisphaerae bacterium]|nr:hypothetical protein [Lentisphaerota bacterium]